MEFDPKRLSKLAGIRDAQDEEPGSYTHGRLHESAPQVQKNDKSDVQQLRSIIRREATRMVQERLSRDRGKRALSEAATMGFAGIGFNGVRPSLGGPLTSARRFASAPSVPASVLSDFARGELEVKAKMLGMIQEEIDSLDDYQLMQLCSGRR